MSNSNMGESRDQYLGNTVHTREDVADIFAYHLEQLLLFAYRYVDSQSVAYDLAMQVFEKIFTYSDKEIAALDKNPEMWKHYLFLAVKHRCIDYLRQKKNRNEILKDLSSSGNQTTINGAYDIFEGEAMNRILTTLADQQRKILEMHLSGFENKEIAEQLDISYNTVRNTLSTSKKKIRQVWDNFMN